jgi:hypothetical protein
VKSRYNSTSGTMLTSFRLNDLPIRDRLQLLDQLLEDFGFIKWCQDNPDKSEQFQLFYKEVMDKLWE